MAKPQGISWIWPRLTVVAAATAACRSKPAACSVMRRGSGTSAASARRWTLMIIGRGTRSSPEMADVPNETLGDEMRHFFKKFVEFLRSHNYWMNNGLHLLFPGCGKRD